jgi:2-oxoglutarate/2-oxoacid ferredoxin oxidoreductase subunit alpha
VRAWPFARAVHDFVAAHQRTYVVEQNRDGQLAGLLALDLDPALATRLRPIPRTDGLPLDARTVTETILAREER